MKYPDRYVITGIVKDGKEKGKRVWLYYSEEGGGWWMWSPIEGWAYRFEIKSGYKFKDALLCAPKTGPWYYNVDPETVEIRPTPAIVKVY